MVNQNEIIIVADYFDDSMLGGAELTTEALLEESPLSVKRTLAKNVSLFNIALHRKKLWIFRNIEQMNTKLIPFIVKHLNYVCIEYDFKFCPKRSLEKYEEKHNKKWEGSIPEIADLLRGARATFFMSKTQKNIFRRYVQEMNPFSMFILGSVFFARRFIHHEKTTTK